MDRRRPRRHDARLSGHAGRHRQPHDHGQRARRARLGRRRHRGGGGHARPAAVDADPRGDRLQAHGRAQGRRDGHRPRAHRDADAAPEGRGQQVRRVLRAGPRSSDARRPRDDRQHGARVRRHVRLLPRRRRDAQLSHHVGPRSRAHRARRGLLEGAGPFPPRQLARPRLHRHARARARYGRPLARRPQAARGADRAHRRQERLRHRARGRVQEARRVREALQGRGPQFRYRPRRRRDRGHHELHEHVEPERADRRGPAGAQRDRQGPQGQAVGQDLARAGEPGRRRLSREGGPAGVSRQGRIQSRRLRLHDLHRELGTACRPRSRRPSTTTVSSPRPCSRATGISRAASARTCRRTISPRRRLSSPTRSPAP